jgi:hypothetical protein
MKMILDSPIVPLGTSNFDMLYYVKTFYPWCDVSMLEFVNFFVKFATL